MKKTVLPKEFKKIGQREFLRAMKATKGKFVTLSYKGGLRFSVVFKKFVIHYRNLKYFFGEHDAEGFDWDFLRNKIKSIYRDLSLQNIGEHIVIELHNNDLIVFECCC